MSENGMASERRSNVSLRAVFPAACEALRPFFETNNQWGGQSQDRLAYHTLKENFPELTSQDAFIAVSTIKRLLAQGKSFPKN